MSLARSMERALRSAASGPLVSGTLWQSLALCGEGRAASFSTLHTIARAGRRPAAPEARAEKQAAKKTQAALAAATETAAASDAAKSIVAAKKTSTGRVNPGPSSKTPKSAATPTPATPSSPPPEVQADGDATLICDTLAPEEFKKNVALAKAPADFAALDYKSTTWFVSRKLDGIRLLAAIPTGACSGPDSRGVQLYTRSGNRVNTLPSIARDLSLLWSNASELVGKEKDSVKQPLFAQAATRLKSLLEASHVFVDGEAVVFSSKGRDDMRSSLSSVSNESEFQKHGEAFQTHYAIFDLLSLTELKSGKSSDSLSVRLCAAHLLFFRRFPDRFVDGIPCFAAEQDDVPGTGESRTRKRSARRPLMLSDSPAAKLKTLLWVNQRPCGSYEELMETFAATRIHRFEGLMLRKDVEYRGGRSSDLLKVKAFKDAEFVVKGVVFNDMKLNGSKIPEKVLAAVVIDYKGHDVKVGSGFTADERRLYFKDPSLIVGKQITVQYFGESSNKGGGLSLRFPIFKACYSGGPRRV